MSLSVASHQTSDEAVGGVVKIAVDIIGIVEHDTRVIGVFCPYLFPLLVQTAVILSLVDPGLLAGLESVECLECSVYYEPGHCASCAAVDLSGHHASVRRLRRRIESLVVGKLYVCVGMKYILPVVVKFPLHRVVASAYGR